MHHCNNSKPALVIYGYQIVIAVAIAISLAMSADAQDWETVNFIQHSAYQAVNSDGSSAYAGGFPIRLRGVVLNNNEDWLDPTAAHDPGVHLFEFGGQSEFFIQAVDLAGDTWDDGDFGGTAVWMGQNYGNHPMHLDPAFNYTDTEWYEELERLQIWRPGSSTSPLVRAGNLVEIRARGGLFYAGKMNVNEQHTNDPIKDYEIVILDEDYGLPAPTSITLADVKDAADTPIFDSTRTTGGELYQSTLVEIENVRFVNTSDWGTDSDLVLTDETGRTLDIHLGLNDSFLSQPAPNDWFNVVGIVDQYDFNGTGGYRLLAMNAADFEPQLAGDFDQDGDVDGSDLLQWQRDYGSIYNDADLADWRINFGTTTFTAAIDFELIPEPATLALLASGTLILLSVGYRNRRIMM
jgi:hypothetical protein